MRQEIWVLQRHLASTLHGPVQAALFASLMKFGQSKTIKPEQVAELVSNLQNAMSQLANDPGFDSRDFNVVWQELCDFWQGVCEVQADFDDDLIARLAASAHALRCVLEVVREALNNAVKHGAASKAKVTLKAERNLLMIEVRNDGKPIAEKRVDGFGSELIREVTHKCELVSIDADADSAGFVTALRASVVLAPANI